MTKITRQEALGIAQLAYLALKEDEIDSLVKQLEDVLSYAQRVKEVHEDVQEPPTKQVNVFREDVVVKTDSETLLAQAPAHEGNYFVLPMILQTTKK